MIGIFILMANVALLGGSLIRSSMIDSSQKNEAKLRIQDGTNPCGTYYDRNGHERDLRTNLMINRHHNVHTGDLILNYTNFTNKDFDINMSELYRMRLYEQEKANRKPGKTVVNSIHIKYPAVHRLSLFDKDWLGNQYYCEGQWYKDLDTGEYYVIRKARIEGTMKQGEFYMRVKDRQLIRMSDEFIKRNEQLNEVYRLTPEDVSKIMIAWNHKVKEEPVVTSDSSLDWGRYFYNNLDVSQSVESLKEKEKLPAEVRPR